MSTTPTIKSETLTEAIRAGCTAADMHLRCSYPECTCKNLPKAITAAVAVVLRPYYSSVSQRDDGLWYFMGRDGHVHGPFATERKAIKAERAQWGKPDA